ncbi:glycosyltransferase family 4 protein [Aeromicrobium terrae]|uniref:Glycosyltransferase family 4 protein n=1 Tax=Aeromicrobium terrae TaxID=2498846 RepID=A0A5C8NFX5_9ACTN|nr:glycosyltransferase family 4 protein [Aeromicrobium terrae]TXL57659.1 glycosyltransferase family 4 protein [Aeromicrobium terrae]
MRVLLVSPAYNDAGRFALLERVGAEHDLTLLTPEEIRTPAFGTMSARPTSPAVTVLANRPWRIGSRHLYRPDWREYRRARPDVVHVEYDPWTPEFWSAMLPLLLLHPRARWVIGTRKNTRHVPRGPLGWPERVLTRLGVARSTLVVAVSRAAENVYRRLGFTDQRIEVLHNVPIDKTVFDGRREEPTDEFRVGYVGSLLPHKGVEVLVAAVAELRERVGEHVRLDLVGRVHDPAFAEHAQRHDWTTFHGTLPNRELPDFLVTLDAFVMPSLVLPDHEEHDGVALLEAMAMRVPSIGSRSGIIPEIIEDGENGLLVDAGDVGQLADRLQELHDDRERADKLADTARHDALRRAGLSSLVAGWTDLYRSVA